MNMEPAAIEGLIAFFVPLVVSLLKQTGWPQVANAIVAVVVYVVFGLLAVLVQGQTFDVNNIVPAVTIFTTVGTAAYVAFWRNWGDPQIAAATSIVKE